ncbi:hypothetical protein [Flavobacterium luteolum]|uniref:hypothetical protein n=1 Tax=Flavobacterium luteolum TaxID=3003259 RepID=UPI00248DAD19|nr:hypothetical protein [Flavobacterium luteolum]
MNTIDKNNGTNKDFREHFSDDRNLAEDLKNDIRKSDTDNREIAERGYTVRNGFNPNRPNPDQEDFADDDLDDLNDDFHKDRDLEDNNDDIYEVELEDDFEENDEFDNPSDLTEEEYDFNETEDVLEDLDEDDDEDDEDEYIEEDIEEDIGEDDDTDYIEDDVQEDKDDERYPENDPRKF